MVHGDGRLPEPGLLPLWSGIALTVMAMEGSRSSSFSHLLRSSLVSWPAFAEVLTFR